MNLIIHKIALRLYSLKSAKLNSESVDCEYSSYYFKYDRDKFSFNVNAILDANYFLSSAILLH